MANRPVVSVGNRFGFMYNPNVPWFFSQGWDIIQGYLDPLVLVE
jgi:hypothetical protein